MNELKGSRWVGLGLVGVGAVIVVAVLGMMLSSRPADTEQSSNPAPASVSAPTPTAESSARSTDAGASPLRSPGITAAPTDGALPSRRPVPTVPNLPSPSIELPVP
jgi:hypothetical protein